MECTVASTKSALTKPGAKSGPFFPTAKGKPSRAGQDLSSAHERVKVKDENGDCIVRPSQTPSDSERAMFGAPQEDESNGA